MAIGKHSDLTIYQDQAQAGFMQRQAQLLDGLVAASNGTVIIGNQEHTGDYRQRAVFDNGPAVARRDLTSTAAQTATALGQDEDISVKRHYKYPLTEVTRSSFKTAGLEPDLFFFMLGADYAEKKFKAMINAGFMACEAALQATANTNDKSGAGAGGGSTITHGNLNGTFQKLGDASGEIRAVWMHSNSYHGLVGQAITDKVTDVANIAIRSGGTFALGRNFVISDFPAAVNDLSTDTYNVLCLRPGAIQVLESEDDEVAIVPTQTGGENLTMRFQAEGAYSVGILGFKWDTSNGGANPTDATLATQTNWDLWAGDTKQTAGARLVVDVSTF